MLAGDNSDPDQRRVAKRAIYFVAQAEDGIRDTSVTGVQTCALPIWYRPHDGCATRADRAGRSGSEGSPVAGRCRDQARSEERRVGKECRHRGTGTAETKTAEP